MDLDQIAGQLAVAVKAQWDAEAAVRRVNDPYPLPVAWRAADDDLAEPWPLLTDLARAWPGGPPGDPARWPRDAAGLAGSDAQIGEVFADWVPTRRLVLLGEPGAGKSVLLIRLLQDLIARRTDTSPVPVLFSLASWDPRQPLNIWLADQLRSTHPSLTTPAPAPVTTTAAATAANSPGDLAQALLESGRILPLLDGLDELPPVWHPVALDALNRALPARQPLVLASRAVPYREALTRPGTTVRLNGAAAIHLLPLTPDTAAAYLRRDAGGPHNQGADRWDTVAARLGTATPVGQALSTPLGLFLARTIYNPRPGAAPGPAAPHPDELCDTTAFPDRTSINTHLFRAYIPAAYAPEHPNPSRWSAAQAHRTFVFLAQFLQNQRAGSPDLAWWQLSQVLHSTRVRLAVGLAVGLMAGILTGLVAGGVVGLVFGVVAGLGLGLGLTVAVKGGRSTAPRTRLRWSWRRLAGRILAGLVAGPVFGGLAGGVFGAVAGEADADTREFLVAYASYTGLILGGAAGLAFGVVAGLIAGLQTEELDLTSSAGPVTRLSLDRRAFIAAGRVAGVAAGFAAFIVVAGISRQVEGGNNGFAALLMAGLAAWLAVGLHTAWPYFLIVRAYLAMRRKVPLDLMTFLQDAHEHRGVLRQVGAVYQFRHIDLQRHLAQQQT